MLRFSVPTCVVVLSLLGCSSERTGLQPAVPAVGPHFTLLTYNVNYGMPRPELALASLRQADADIVCLQETNEAWERSLRPGLAGMYPFMAFRHSSGAGGMAILSKRPFGEIHYGPSEAGWFPSWVIVAETPAGPVQVANVHLHPAVTESGKVGAGAYLGTRNIREEEIQEVYPHIDAKAPAVFAGDFNEEESGLAVEYLRSHGFTDALSRFDKSSPTWEWPVSSSGSVALHLRFDHILYSRELRCLSARVIKAGGSDHYPVLAVFGK